MVDLSPGDLTGIAAIALTLLAFVFWFGHHRSDLVRAKLDIILLRQDVDNLKVQIAVLANAQVRRLTTAEEMKRIVPSDPEDPQ